MKKLLTILFVLIAFAASAQSTFNRWFPTSGTDTYTTNITSYSAYANTVVYLKFGNTNTGAATININSIGAANIRYWDGNSWEPLPASHIDVNTVYKLSYNGSYFEMEAFGSGSVSWGDLLGTLSDQTDLQAALDAKANEALTVDTKTDDYTLVLTDKDTKLILMNDATGNDVTVPLNSSVAFPVGTIITIVQKNTELTTIVATGGVTINSSAGNLNGPGQNVPMVLVKIATDEWDLFNGSDIGLNRTAASVSAGTLTLNLSNKMQNRFTVASTVSSNITLALSNTTNAEMWGLHFNVTGTITVTLPSDFRMSEDEVDAGRYNSGTRVLTLIGTTAQPFEFSAAWNGSVWLFKATKGFL